MNHLDRKGGGEIAHLTRKGKYPRIDVSYRRMIIDWGYIILFTTTEMLSTIGMRFGCINHFNGPLKEQFLQ
jgi:hypothetical protein